MTTVYDANIARAAEYINAVRAADSWRYTARENGCDYIVTEFDMARLGAMLASGIADAYNRWCTETDAVEL